MVVPLIFTVAAAAYTPLANVPVVVTVPPVMFITAPVLAAEPAP